MLNFFKLIIKMCIIALLFTGSCYASNQNNSAKFFDSCTKVSGNKYHCQLNMAADAAKIAGYSCHGNTCVLSTPPIKVYGFNNLPYALCSKSKCTIDKNNSKIAVCNCPIINTKNNISSISIGMNNRAKSLPVYDARGNMIKITSNFSMINIFDFKNNLKINKPVTVCKYNQQHAYTDCFGVVCDVDKTNTLNAICRCPIKESKAFVSVSSKCKTDSGEVYCAVNPNQYQHTGSSILYRHFVHPL